MRLPTIAIAAGAFALSMLLAACAQVATPGTTGKKSGTIACDGFVKAGSALAADIAQYTEKPGCERKYHPGGAGYYEAYSLFGRERAASGSSAPDSMMVLVFRAYGGSARDLPRLDANSFDHVENFADLSDSMTADVPGVTGNVLAKTFDWANSGLAVVCLDAVTANQDGSHTVIDVCRSSPPGATRADRIALAQTIAANDLPSINP